MKWQSPTKIWGVDQPNQSFLANWTDWEVSSHYSLWRLSSLSEHLSLGSTARFGRPSASIRCPSFSHSTSLSLSIFACCCSEHSSRRRSLLMRVLSDFDTHHRNRHMGWCGCHEILIQRCITVLFLLNFSLYPIQLWFWWLSYSNRSFQLISIQLSGHHSDSARKHQSCNQKPLISTSNWRQAHLQKHISWCNSNKAPEFIASTVYRIHSLLRSKAVAVLER